MGSVEAYGLAFQSIALAYQGETGAARAVADAALDAAAELGGIAAGLAYLGVGRHGFGRG